MDEGLHCLRLANSAITYCCLCQACFLHAVAASPDSLLTMPHLPSAASSSCKPTLLCHNVPQCPNMSCHCLSADGDGLLRANRAALPVTVCGGAGPLSQCFKAATAPVAAPCHPTLQTTDRTSYRQQQSLAAMLPQHAANLSGWPQTACLQ